MGRRYCDVSGCYIRAPTTFLVRKDKLHVYTQLGYQFKRRRQNRICEAHFEARFILGSLVKPALHKDAVPLPVNAVGGDAIIRARAALGLKGEAEAVASSGSSNAKTESVHYNTETLEYCEVKMESLSDYEGHEHTEKVEEQLQTTKVKIKGINTQKSSKGPQLIKRATFSCNQCEFTVASRQGLYSHKNSKHAVVRFPCDQCAYAPAYKGALKIHKRRMHPVDPLSLDDTVKAEIGLNEPSFIEAKIKVEENIDDPLSLTDTTEQNKIFQNERENIVIPPVLTDIKKEPN